MSSSHIQNQIPIPAWRPPKAPLPPHRLAKLANALGVSTPIPAFNDSTLSLFRSRSEASNHMDYRRSPTPSTTTSSYPVASTSKYLLHVIPPMHLPHESDTYDDTELTPPPASASGYHAQFRRGVLVPVHPTIQSQLMAIAKEYALPSTAGLVLYLVSSVKSDTKQALDQDEPGPRLSEDIWKHIWNRVIRVEQQEEQGVPSRSHTPHQLGLSLSIATRSTPFLPQDPVAHLRPPIPFLKGDPIQPTSSNYFLPSPTTPSTFSDVRSNAKSAPPSSASASQSEPSTPDTSIEDYVRRANSLDLPGLQSPSLIPILAKVEFDIDRKKAGWYEPWLRSRKVNHTKRVNSRLGFLDQQDTGTGAMERPQEKKTMIQLLTGRNQTTSPISFNVSDESLGGQPGDNDLEAPKEAGYEELSDRQSEPDPDGYASEEENDSVEDEATARVASISGGKDPLEDVFGNDADTWADVHHSEGRKSTRNSNPHVINLALTAADLSSLPENFESDDDRIAGKEHDEVEELLEQMSKPSLSISIPASPTSTSKRIDSPTGLNVRKTAPPPLVLVPKTTTEELQIPDIGPVPNSAGSTNLPYLGGISPDGSYDEREQDPTGAEDDDHDNENEEFTEYTRVRSPEESEKRGGAVFDTLDLGLDPSEDYDESDPHDRRKSQYLMRAQLDEIERTMAQLSPRFFPTDLAEEESFTRNSMTLSPVSPTMRNLSPGGFRNSDVFPPSPPPRLPQHAEPAGNEEQNQAWPAVSFASLSQNANTSFKHQDAPPSPPQLAVNGVTTSAPKSFMTARPPNNEVSAETEKRKRELEESHPPYPSRPPPPVPSTVRDSKAAPDSPVIPLSPDPFGRYSSASEYNLPLIEPQQSHSQWEAIMNYGSNPSVDIPDVTRTASTEPQSQVRSSTTSRFSADSITGGEPVAKPTSNRSTLMTVRSLKRLWRKSNNKSQSSVQVPTPSTSTPSSGRNSPHAPPTRPERPSQEQLHLPDIPAIPVNSAAYGRLSPQTIPIPPPQVDRLPEHLPPVQERQHSLAPPQPTPQAQQFSSAPFIGRSPNPTPIIASQMQPSRARSSLDQLHFDQESPYPTRPSQNKYPPRPTSPPQLPPIPEKEKKVRKSILKSWKTSSSSSISYISQATSDSRSSLERQNHNNNNNGVNGVSRGHRPSITTNMGNTRGSQDTVPSPRIPEQYLAQQQQQHGVGNGGGGGSQHPDTRQSVGLGSRSATATPTESSTNPSNAMLQSQLSLARTVSHESLDDTPSFDTSQFEIVSPKSGSSLSYPYHGLDHD